MRVVAAIPCFNTGRFIGGIVAKAKDYVDEVIIINDGSHDDTLEQARAAGALVVDHAANRGYGRAIRSCFEAAVANAADVLVILDGDGQHNPDEIPVVLDPILKGEGDIVIGSRFVGDGCQVPLFRRFGIRVIIFLYNFGSKVKVSDGQSGYRAYSKRALDSLSLTENGMAASIDILVDARGKGLVIKELPISCIYFQPSLNVRAVKHGTSVGLNVIKVRLRGKWRKLVQKRNV